MPLTATEKLTNVVPMVFGQQQISVAQLQASPFFVESVFHCLESFAELILLK